jgi:hypothetical protein
MYGKQILKPENVIVYFYGFKVWNQALSSVWVNGIQLVQRAPPRRRHRRPPPPHHIALHAAPPPPPPPTSTAATARHLRARRQGVELRANVRPAPGVDESHDVAVHKVEFEKANVVNQDITFQVQGLKPGAFKLGVN